MRLVDYLSYLLQAHAATLQRLGALLGDHELFELLETAGNDDGLAPPPLARPDHWGLWVQPPKDSDPISNWYQRLEGVVRECGLPATLEFHLWAYPYYRLWIESSWDLDSQIIEPTALVEEAVQNARAWIRALPLSPTISQRAEAAAEVAWLRFRSTSLGSAGRRPLASVT